MSRNVMVRETLAQRLVEIRKAKGLTQVDLAKLTGISPRMIAYYETRAKNPSPATIVALAKALKVSIDDLLGYRKPKDEPVIKNKKLLRRLKDFDQLSDQDQKVILRYIDGILGKEK